MGKFLDIYRKQGGAKLIREFWDNGVLGEALVLLLVLGKSKTALELLRNCITLKTYQKLSRRYLPLLKEFDRNSPSDEGLNSKQPERKVWVCWLQGIEQAPEVVKRCYQSLHDCITDREIVLLTAQNYEQYAQLPEPIMQKYRSGIISRTHFSDLLRVEILCRYGGTWIDATVMCLSQGIPSYMLDADLFLFQKLKPGADGAAIRISSWFITAAAGNKILRATRHLLWEYWLKEDRLRDYFLLHHFLMMSINYYASDWQRVVQFPNSLPHVLLLRLFQPFDEAQWQAIRQACPIQKLSYKFEPDDLARPDTYYRHILQS